MKTLNLSLLMFGLLLCQIIIGSPLNILQKAVRPQIISSQNNITPTKLWTEFLIYNEVKVEYKFKTCNSVQVKNQVLVLFRFTNLTANKLTFSWITKVWRNNVCSNCDNLNDSEYAHSITLNSNEIVTADGLSKENKSLYIFANFIKLSPGMSSQTLTNFEFVNMSTIVAI